MSTQNTYTTITDRAFIIVGGDDRFDFLQGLITNDVMKCRDGHLLYSCLLTPQGKYLYDFFMFDHNDTLVIDINAEDAAKMASKLKLYKLRSKVTLDVSLDAFHISQIWGAGELSDVKDKMFKDPRRYGLGHRIYSQNDISLDGIQGDYNYQRVICRAPEGIKDIEREKSTMLEALMDEMDAVDFKKGCYMGQELTARTHYRGLLKRKLYSYVASAGAHISQGDKVLSEEGKNIGQIRSVYNSGQAPFGFALMKVDSDFDAPIKTEDNIVIKMV